MGSERRVGEGSDTTYAWPDRQKQVGHSGGHKIRHDPPHVAKSGLASAIARGTPLAQLSGSSPPLQWQPYTLKSAGRAETRLIKKHANPLDESAEKTTAAPHAKSDAKLIAGALVTGALGAGLGAALGAIIKACMAKHHHGGSEHLASDTHEALPAVDEHTESQGHHALMGKHNDGDDLAPHTTSPSDTHPAEKTNAHPAPRNDVEYSLQKQEETNVVGITATLGGAAALAAGSTVAFKDRKKRVEVEHWIKAKDALLNTKKASKRATTSELEERPQHAEIAQRPFMNAASERVSTHAIPPREKQALSEKQWTRPEAQADEAVTRQAQEKKGANTPGSTLSEATLNPLHAEDAWLRSQAQHEADDNRPSATTPQPNKKPQEQQITTTSTKSVQPQEAQHAQSTTNQSPSVLQATTAQPNKKPQSQQVTTTSTKSVLPQEALKHKKSESAPIQPPASKTSPNAVRLGPTKIMHSRRPQCRPLEGDPFNLWEGLSEAKSPGETPQKKRVAQQPFYDPKNAQDLPWSAGWDLVQKLGNVMTAAGVGFEAGFGTGAVEGIKNGFAFRRDVLSSAKKQGLEPKETIYEETRGVVLEVLKYLAWSSAVSAASAGAGELLRAGRWSDLANNQAKALYNRNVAAPLANTWVALTSLFQQGSWTHPSPETLQKATQALSLMPVKIPDVLFDVTIPAALTGLANPLSLGQYVTVLAGKEVFKTLNPLNLNSVMDSVMDTLAPAVEFAYNLLTDTVTAVVSGGVHALAGGGYGLWSGVVHAWEAKRPVNLDQLSATISEEVKEGSRQVNTWAVELGAHKGAWSRLTEPLQPA